MSSREKHNSISANLIMGPLSSDPVTSQVDETPTFVRKGKTMKTLKNQIQRKGGFAQILSVIVLVMLILGRVAPAEELLVSEARDISDPGMTEIYVRDLHDTDNFNGIQRQHSFAPNEIYTNTLTCTVDPAECALFQESNGHDELAIPERTRSFTSVSVLKASILKPIEITS